MKKILHKSKRSFYRAEQIKLAVLKLYYNENVKKNTLRIVYLSQYLK